MGWKRTGFKGINAEDSLDKARNIEDTGLELTASNKLAYPGAVSFDDMTGVSFNSVFTGSAHFATSITSVWFRDDGSTTT